MMLPKFSSIIIINKHTHTHTKDTDSGKPPFNKKYLCKWCIFTISKNFGILCLHASVLPYKATQFLSALLAAIH